METFAALLIAGAIGACVGAVLTFVWRYSERQSERPAQPAPVIPEGADKVLSVLSSSAVIVDSDDSVLRASAPAFALGLIQADRLTQPELMELVRAVRRDGQVREAELGLATRSRSLQVAARVAPLSSRLVVVLVEDRTRERRVESIRRDFVANVSHELKTPIGALNLLAEAVGEARDDPDAVERFAARMRGESERLTRLVQQIIDLSRLQDDELLEEPVPVAIPAVVDAAVEYTATDAERRSITVSTEVDDAITVLGDPHQLRSAVANLVENAIAYSAENTKVTVLARRNGEAIDITVADQGPGIPDAEQERIFERFYRVDPARQRSTGGTGLGLSIVKHVVASHGGAVRVWSKPGEGSSFTLSFPAYSAPARWEPSAHATGSSAHTTFHPESDHASQRSEG